MHTLAKAWFTVQRDYLSDDNLILFVEKYMHTALAKTYAYISLQKNKIVI